MSYDHSTTLRYCEELQQAISDMVRQSEQTDEVPTMNQSDVLRKLLWEGLETCDELADLVDPSTAVLLERERFLERAAKVNNLRTGFETRVKDNFTRRFKNGYQPEQLAKFAANMREEARILWSDTAIELEAENEEEAQEMRARRRECIDYVDAVVDNAIEAVEQSDADPLDPDTMFDSFSLVEQGKDRELAQERGADLEREARRVLEAVETIDVDAVATALAKEHGIGRSTAKESVQEAHTELLEERREQREQQQTDEPESDRESYLRQRAQGVDETGTVVTDDGSEAYMPDHSRDDDVEPSEELIEAAQEELGQLAIASIPTKLEVHHDCTTEEAVAARDLAVERRNRSDADAQEVPADD